MKKICFVTAARSEYGLLKWIMKEVEQCNEFCLQLIVTGGHLLWEQGHTIDQIEKDGFFIDAVIDSELDTKSDYTIAASTARMAEKLSKAFQQLTPDYLVVLGDRYELLPICSIAFLMHIPIIHISGGDVTEGAIDDNIRNAVSMLASYHFPGTEESAENIRRMRGNNKNIWVVGEPGLDSFFREKLMSRTELVENLKLEDDRKWVLFTYHTETMKTVEENLETVSSILELLKDMPEYQIVTTYANADLGGIEINNLLEEMAKNYPNQFIAVSSLGQKRYLSYMKQVEFVIGNSSSGIVEAPFLHVPVINIGDRQKGRHQCSNIIQASNNKDSIQIAIMKAINVGNHKKKQDNQLERLKDLQYWGDGHTAERIVRILKKELV